MCFSGGGGGGIEPEQPSLAIKEAPAPVSIAPKALKERDAEDTERQRVARQSRRRGVQSLRIDADQSTGLSIPL